MVEVEVADKTFPSFEIVTNQGVEEMDINVKEMLPGLFGGKKKRRKTSVGEARADPPGRGGGAPRRSRARSRARPSSGRSPRASSSWTRSTRSPAASPGRGPDVSREGVQRDLLPIVEGTSVNTKYGFVKTDHVLFIAAGAFHVSKPSDLIPELQGRFPIRVELDSLTEADFVRILTEPENALLKQYRALLGAEGVDLSFSDEAIGEIARDAERVNRALENIGARRLHTILERLLEEISFAGPENAGQVHPHRALRRRRGRWRISSRTRTCRATCCELEAEPRRQSRLSPSSLGLSLGCGKKGDPQPPLPRGPHAVSDLAVEQEGDDAVLTFTFPDRLLTGAPLTDLASIEVYRVDQAVAPADRAAARQLRAGTRHLRRRGCAGVAHLPGEGARRAATNVRLAEEAFYREAKRAPMLSLAVDRGAHAGRVASCTAIRSALLWERGLGSDPLAYAVISVRRNGERSPLSNIVTLTPRSPPTRPAHPATARGGPHLPRVARAARRTCSDSPPRSAATASTGGRSPRRSTTARSTRSR